MHWYWFDRFTEFESGRAATAIKNVSLAEDHLHDYFPGYPVMPNSLILEGMAQVAGTLVGEVNEFEERVVLAKVSNVRFHALAQPGDTLTYKATIDSLGPDGAFIVGTSHLGDQLQAECEFCLAFLDDRNETRELFKPDDFLRMLRVFRLFEVGRNADGSPLRIPERLLRAEQASNSQAVMDRAVNRDDKF